MIDIREKLHDYINNSDDKLLKMMYALAKEYNSDDNIDYTFSEADIKGFEERKEKLAKGESKLYGWNDAKAIITGKRKPE